MSTPCKTLNLWGNITGYQHNPTNSRGFIPTKSWWTEGGASHILTMIRLVVQDQEKKNAMTQARAVTYTNRNSGLKRNWSLLQETRFYCHDIH